MADVTTQEIADFRGSVRDLCAARFARHDVRESGQAQALDRGAWSELADLGVLGMLAPTDVGGLGLGVAATAALWEELGTGLVPGPLTWTALVAQYRLEAGDGRAICAGAPASRSPLVVEHSGDADLLVLLGESPRIYAKDEWAVAVHESVDPFTSIGTVSLAGDGAPVGDGRTYASWVTTGACLNAAYLVGICRLAIDLTMEHARTRVQFGRPIGGFQAVKHLLADMLVATEMAAAAVVGAAEAIDAGDEGARRYASGAKVLAGDAARLATKTSIQLHGAMGYTWEADPHLLWKRAMIYDGSFGSADRHAGAIGATLGT